MGMRQHSRAALFVCLAVERTMPRESLTAIFWPESDDEGARHALRQSIYQIRKSVGADWIVSHAHQLSMSDEVRCDADEFASAIERDDLESAVRLYRGPFLDGIHLVELRSWQSWVDARRARYARAFRNACRSLLEGRRASGDLAGAVAIAERWAAHDPLEAEAQHRLMECLTAVDQPTEALHHFDAYARMLARDGLAPSSETAALAERLRSRPAALPPLPDLPAPPAPPIVEATAPPLPASPERLDPRRRRWVVGAAVFAGVAAVWWVARHSGPAAPSTDAPPAIAVFPFTVRGDPEHLYLGDGIVSLLGAALDGADALRPVDGRATFAAVAATGGPSTLREPPQAANVAARLGAQWFVLGDLTEVGGRLQIDVTLYRLGDACGALLRATTWSEDCARPATAGKVVVSGAVDSVFALVDQLGARLLAALNDRRADRLVRTASLTTASLPAFKAYLRGERLMREGQFELAAGEYETATSLDSTFALAHYRLALAREWAPLPGNEAAAEAAGRHGARLSTRDRDLLSAFRDWRAGRAIEAERAYRTILSRYPDDVDAWLQLGEIQFHHFPLLGRSLTESEQAWREVLAREPGNLSAATHLARIAAAAGRPRALDSLVASLGEGRWRTDRRLEEMAVHNALAQGDTVAARLVAGRIRSGEDFAVWRVAGFLTAFTRDPARTRTVIQELGRGPRGPTAVSSLHWFTSLLDLAAGRLADAESARSTAVGVERTAAPDGLGTGFESISEWFAATLPLPYPDATLIEIRRRALGAVPPAGGVDALAFGGEIGNGQALRWEPLRQYTLGVLAIRLGDLPAARRAASELERFAGAVGAPPLLRDLARGLRARVARAAGDLEGALRLLGSMEQRDTQGDVSITPFSSRAGERYLRGEILAALGRDAEALRWFESLGTGSVTEVPLLPIATLRAAELEERLGNTTEAAQDYARVLDLWRNADPEYEGMKGGAQRGLQRIADRQVTGGW
jgi:DNA-binding SARP family transcriptional activator/TolB-like protein